MAISTSDISTPEITTPDGSRTLAAVLGAWGRTLAAPDAARPTSSGPETTAPQAPSLEDSAALAEHALRELQAAPTSRKLPTSMREARRVFAEQEAQIGALERQLHDALARAGRRTTEARNLEARVRALLPLADQVKIRDRALEQARAAAVEAERARAAEHELRLAAERALAAALNARDIAGAAAGRD